MHDASTKARGAARLRQSLPPHGHCHHCRGPGVGWGRGGGGAPGGMQAWGWEKETTRNQPWAETKTFLLKQRKWPTIAAAQYPTTACVQHSVTIILRQSCLNAPRVRHSHPNPDLVHGTARSPINAIHTSVHRVPLLRTNTAMFRQTAATRGSRASARPLFCTKPLCDRPRVGSERSHTMTQMGVGCGGGIGHSQLRHRAQTRALSAACISVCCPPLPVPLAQALKVRKTTVRRVRVLRQGSACVRGP